MLKHFWHEEKSHSSCDETRTGYDSEVKIRLKPQAWRSCEQCSYLSALTDARAVQRAGDAHALLFGEH